MNKKTIISLLLILFSLSVSAQNEQHVYKHVVASIHYKDFQKADSLLNSLSATDTCKKFYYLGIVSFNKSKYEEAIGYFDKSNSYNDADFYKSIANIRINNIPLACESLKDYLRTDNKKPKHKIILDAEISKISNSRLFVDIWKTEWYSEIETKLASIENGMILGKDVETLDSLYALELKYPRNSKIYYYRSLIWHKMVSTKNALADINKAISIEPKPEYFAHLGKIYFETGKFDDAEKAYSRIPNSDSMKYSVEYAKMSIKNQDYPKAIKTLEDYLVFYYKSDEALYYKSLAIFLNKESINALISINKAIEINPSKAEYFLLRSDIFFETKNYVFAENDLTMALDIQPSEDIYYKRGEIRELNNNPTGACLDYQKAYKLGMLQALYKTNKLCP